MDIQAEKIGLIQWIADLNDSSIINKIKEIRRTHSFSDDWWDELSTAEKESVKRGLKDIEEGRIHSHQTVKKAYEKFLFF